MPRELSDELGIEEIIDAEIDRGVARTWELFRDFTRIPRKTGNEEGIRNYLQDWANTKKYETETDAVGNLLVFVPATPGYKNAPGVVIQAHMDMVCVGEPDPATDGVTPHLSENGEWLMGTDTTLGADNGIGLAAAIALADEKINHGPLALMITVNEEDGIMGAMQMSFENKLEEYKYLLNFDSEEEGEATISSAGGGYSHISLPLKELFSENVRLMKLSIEGLKGGHSGIDIGEDRMNSIQVLTVLLSKLCSDSGVHIVSLKGGQASNVIPSTAEATLAVTHSSLKRMEKYFEKVKGEILEEAKGFDEKELNISFTSIDGGKSRHTHHISWMAGQNLIAFLRDLPHGVLEWSKTVENLVQTSTNLATVSTEDKTLKVTLMTRSSVNEELDNTRNKIKQTVQFFGGEVEEPEPFSGWPAKTNSRVTTISKDAWKEVTGKELKILGTHAGLECGAIIGKYPHLEAISIGPEIRGAHTIGEKVQIKSVTNFFNFAKNILEGLAVSS